MLKTPSRVAITGASGSGREGPVILLLCGTTGPERTSKMPKLKTKSGAKKRFKMTGTGKVKAAAQGKRHGMIKRTAKFIQKARGTMVLNDSDAKIVKKYMPYAR
jgi:large subunit ribosomal protein L35